MTRMGLARELHYWMKRIRLDDLPDNELDEFRLIAELVNRILDGKE